MFYENMAHIDMFIRNHERTKEMLNIAGKDAKDLIIDKITDDFFTKVKNVKDFVIFVSSIKEPCCTTIRALMLKRKIENIFHKNDIYYSSFVTHALNDEDYICYVL
jgi:hypothetical protein